MREDRFLKVNIQRSSNLDLDPKLMHPHVKVHIVRLADGQYIKKEEVSVSEAPTTHSSYNYEMTTQIKTDHTANVSPLSTSIRYPNRFRAQRQILCSPRPLTHTI